jgi:hypothetical protein
MAIPILNHLDLRSVSELQNAILHKTTESSASNVEGKIIYDTGTDSAKVYNGSIWVDLGGDISRVNITAGDGLTGTVDTTGGEHTQTLTVVGGDGITANADEIEVTVDNSTIELSASTGAGAVRIKDAGVVTAKLADDAVTTIKITDSNVTTAKIADDGVTLAKLAHQANNTVFKVSASGVPIAGTIDTANITADAVDGTKIADDAVDSEHIAADSLDTEHYAVGSVDNDALKADAVDGTKIADDAINSEHITNGSVDNVHLANDGITIGGTDVSLGGTITALTALTDLDLTAGNKTIFDTVGANTLTMGASGTTITIPGNLVVTGTTITKNETVKIVENNTIEFEGTTADDAHQIKLSGGEPTADRTVTLPDNSGTIALTTDTTDRQFTTLIGNASAVAINLKKHGVTVSGADKNLSAAIGNDSTQFMVQLIEVSSGLTAMADVARGADGLVTITFASAPANNAIRVLITKIG